MAAAINSTQQLANLITKFQQENEESDHNIKKILFDAKTFIPAQNGVKDLSQFVGFRQLLAEELNGYKDLQELSKKVSEFLESINQNLATREEELNSACFTLHKAEGSIGIGDLFPSFHAYYLQVELNRPIQVAEAEESGSANFDISDFVDIENSPENAERETESKFDETFSLTISNALTKITEQRADVPEACIPPLEL